MLAKRIIPCLDIKDGQTVKGTNFVNLRYAGDPLELAELYAKQGADELVFLDISATIENRKTLFNLVKRIAQHINIPFTVGGGISSEADVSVLLEMGADKISINSAAIKSPELIDKLSLSFGSQCIIVAIDTRITATGHKVFSHGGRKETVLLTQQWAKEVQERGAGEILLTSMDADGTKNGFDVPITEQLSKTLSLPVIASGGAGKKEDFLEIFNHHADAALAASVFHFGTILIPELKSFLLSKKVPIRILPSN